jgi:RES domain-containing protein
MKVYRISKTLYINDLTGTGAKLYGGRWNRPGVPVLYTSEHISLSILELVVNFSAHAALYNNYSLATLEINDELIFSIPESKLPKDWKTYNNPKCWDILEKAFYQKNVYALKLPSVVVPREFNILINPLHKAHANNILHTVESYSLDSRLSHINK